jgi:hypothetical protein
MKSENLLGTILVSMALMTGCIAAEEGEDPSDARAGADDSTQAVQPESEDAVSFDAPDLEAQSVMVGCSGTPYLVSASQSCSWLLSMFYSGSSVLFRQYNQNRSCSTSWPTAGNYICVP